MRWPIRYQILVPFAALLLAAIALTSISAAWLAARRSEQATLAQLNHVVETLGESSFPYTDRVLEQMKGLSGAEFLALDAQRQVVASTLGTPVNLPAAWEQLPNASPSGRVTQLAAIVLDAKQYRGAAVTRRSPSRTPVLLVLFPESSWKEARSAAAFAPLAVGAVTLVAMVFVAAWLSERLSRRIRRLRQQVAAIAAGDFHPVPLDKRQDELQELTHSVNSMSGQLQSMQQTIAQTERTRLLGQLAGGLAHQLRNAVTGARLAVQIHQRRCVGSPADDSLDVSLRQLALMEEQVRGMLSLGKPEHRPAVPQPVDELAAEVISLVEPASQHAGVQLSLHIEASARRESACIVADSASVRTAVLNLLLNGVEAAGRGGAVELTVSGRDSRIVIDISDSGPGPAAELETSMFDLFVTGKPEGVGFGLALARRVAEEQGGELSWHRARGQTHFVLELPAASRLEVTL